MLLPLYKGRHGAATGGRRQRALRPGEAPPGTARLRWAALRRTAPHRAAPPRAVPTRLRSPTAAPARRAHPQLARSTAAARGRVTCPRDSGTSRQHTPPTPQRNATQRNATPPARLTAGTEEEQQQRETGGAARRCHTAGRGALPRGRRARQQRRHRSCEGRGGAADRRGGARSHGSRIGRPSRCRGRAGFLRRAGLAAGPPGFHRALRGVCRLSHPGRRGFLI